MKKAIAISTLILTALTQSAPADARSASKEENVGVASGALIGAAAGGPVGFILGAAFGGLLGGQVEKANTADELQTQLNAASVYQIELQQEIAQLKTEKTKVHKSSMQGSEMLQMDLLFHTSVTALDDADTKRVTQLATFLKKYPSLSVKLDGFADPRGAQEKNQKLSEQRIESVKTILVSQGINEERIFTQAHGEKSSLAPKGDMDAYALERRVTIRFSPQSDGAAVADSDKASNAVASNQ